MRAGAKTSREIAQAVRLTLSDISVALCGLAEHGIIERVGVVNIGALGRPYAE
jgi:predicted transcriptional regulator